MAEVDDEAPLEVRIRAGRAMRDLGHAVVGHHVGRTALEAVADTLERMVVELSSGAPRHREPASFGHGHDWGMGEGDDETLWAFEDRPVSGRASPWGLDVDVRHVGDEIHAGVTMRSAHEGAPGRCHGGIVLALFDDVFGFLLGIAATPAFTGELSVRFRAGVPLHVPLVCRVRLDGRERRKLFMTGELVDDAGTVYATSTATFIAVERELITGTVGD